MYRGKNKGDHQQEGELEFFFYFDNDLDHFLLLLSLRYSSHEYKSIIHSFQAGTNLKLIFFFHFWL